MTVRSFFRAIGWLTAELWPAQFVDAMRERDYRAGAEWDAAEALAEAEAEEEVWAPRKQCRGCGDAKTDSHVCLRAAAAAPENPAAACGEAVSVPPSTPASPPLSPAVPAAAPNPAGAEPPSAPVGTPSPEPDVGSPNDIIQIALHRTEHIPGGGWVGYSDDFPDKQFLIVPKK